MNELLSMSSQPSNFDEFVNWQPYHCLKRFLENSWGFVTAKQIARFTGWQKSISSLKGWLKLASVQSEQYPLDLEAFDSPAPNIRLYRHKVSMLHCDGLVTSTPVLRHVRGGEDSSPFPEPRIFEDDYLPDYLDCDEIANSLIRRVPETGGEIRRTTIYVANAEYGSLERLDCNDMHECMLNHFLEKGVDRVRIDRQQVIEILSDPMFILTMNARHFAIESFIQRFAGDAEALPTEMVFGDSYGNRGFSNRFDLQSSFDGFCSHAIRQSISAPFHQSTLSDVVTDSMATGMVFLGTLDAETIEFVLSKLDRDRSPTSASSMPDMLSRSSSSTTQVE